MRKNKKTRPIIVTIEQVPDTAPNANGRVYPAGRPTVTGMRTMTRWEHLRYNIKNAWSRLWRKSQPPLQSVHKDLDTPPLSVGVRISEEQYIKLIQGDPQVTMSARYLKRAEVITMDLVPPHAASPHIEEEYRV